MGRNLSQGHLGNMTGLADSLGPALSRSDRVRVAVPTLLAALRKHSACSNSGYDVGVLEF